MADLSTLRAYLATLSPEALKEGHSDALMRFAREPDIDEARGLYEEAMEWSRECERRMNPQQEAR